jgi:hypothetical protein
MFTELHWIDGPWPGRLAISARPRGGDWLEDELMSWRAAGVTKVVSLLTPDEEEALGLEREKEASLDAGLSFVSFPIVDRSVPSSDEKATRLIEELDSDLTPRRTRGGALPPGNRTLGTHRIGHPGGARSRTGRCHPASQPRPRGHGSRNSAADRLDQRRFSESLERRRLPFRASLAAAPFRNPAGNARCLPSQW